MGSRGPQRYLVIIRAQAADDVREIHEYIAQDSPQNAEAVVERLLAAMDSLVTFPRRGKRAYEAEEVSVDLRQIICDSFRVLYMVRGREVHVLTVRHAARDWWRPGRIW